MRANYLNASCHKLFLLLTFSFYFLGAASNDQLFSVSLGIVQLNLQSRAAVGDPHEFLVELLTNTAAFLDEAFNENYNSDGVFSNGLFSHVGVTVESFELDYATLAEDNEDIGNEDKHRFFANIEFTGLAYFNTMSVPSEDNISALLFRTFQDENNYHDYVNMLRQSDAEFLQRLAYAVVRVNDFVVSSSEPIIGRTDGAEGNKNNGENRFQLAGASIPQIIIVAGAIGGFLLILVVCYCFCCRRSKRIPSKTNDGNDQENNNMEITKGEVQRTSTGVTSKGTQGDDVDVPSTMTPCSINSIISQDSSLFTYNPSSRISFDASTLSTATNFNDVSNLVDIESWKQKSNISGKVLPFGNDLSAIEVISETHKKDLSLIEEGDEEATPQRNSSGSNLSARKLSQHERRADRELSNNRISRQRSYGSSTSSRLSKSSTSKNSKKRSLSKGNSSLLGHDDYALASSSDKNDIIQELMNLSLQIDEHRGR